MDSRTLDLHVFTSAKGGVGKSTLAVACAQLRAAEPGRRVVLVDANLTGTSLADGLSLCAPELPVKEGAPDFFASPDQVRHLSRADTQKARRLRKSQRWTEQPPAPPFLNDLLVRRTQGRECSVEALCWKHERDDRVLYLPSSPFEKDIDIALGWLYNAQPYRWLQRLAWLIDGMREQMKALTDIVIDLPPGLFGFTQQVLAMLCTLRERGSLPPGFPPWKPEHWRVNPFLVTTPDRNDLAIAVDYRLAHRAELPELELLLNRYTGGLSLQDWFEEQYPELPGLPEELKLRVDFMRPLSELFTRGGLELNSEERNRLRRALRLEALS